MKIHKGGYKEPQKPQPKPQVKNDRELLQWLRESQTERVGRREAFNALFK